MVSAVLTCEMSVLKLVSSNFQDYTYVNTLVSLKALCLTQFGLLSGMFAIRAEREYVIDEDFMKAVRKVSDAKKLESKLDYKPV